MADKNDTKKENAKAYARRVIEKDFGQTVDDETLDSLAVKILKVMPQSQDEKLYT